MAPADSVRRHNLVTISRGLEDAHLPVAEMVGLASFCLTSSPKTHNTAAQRASWCFSDMSRMLQGHAYLLTTQFLFGLCSNVSFSVRTSLMALFKTVTITISIFFLIFPYFTFLPEHLSLFYCIILFTLFCLCPPTLPPSTMEAP